MIIEDYVLAIDPGTTQSGVSLVRVSDYRPMFGIKDDNEVVKRGLHNLLRNCGAYPPKVKVVIEKMQGNAMPVGSETFETCVWIGRFSEYYENWSGKSVEYVFRREEYKTLCGNIYSHNDKGIRNALADRFAYGTPNFGKGTKNEPGWFYKFAADAWSAYAIAITYIDRENGL